MKIVVAGDNHGLIDPLKRVIEDNPDGDMFLHTGDSMMSAIDILPFESVKGNNDFECFPISKTVDTPAGKIYLIHGSRPFIYNVDNLKEQDIKVVIKGHTHYHKIEDDHGVTFVNPGALSNPRDNTNGTYLIITVEDEKFDFKFVYLD